MKRLDTLPDAPVNFVNQPLRSAVVPLKMLIPPVNMLAQPVNSANQPLKVNNVRLNFNNAQRMSDFLRLKVQYEVFILRRLCSETALTPQKAMWAHQ